MEKEDDERPAFTALLIAAARRALDEAGYLLERSPGRGRASNWAGTKDGRAVKLTIRTSRDRWVAFQPLNGGKAFRTLDDVDLVCVAALDRKEDPQFIEVFILPAKDIRPSFEQAFHARKKFYGKAPQDEFGMWVALDRIGADGAPNDAGSHLLQHAQHLANYPFGALSGGRTVQPAPSAASGSTIASIVADARARISAVAGVPISQVNLDVRITN